MDIHHHLKNLGIQTNFDALDWHVSSGNAAVFQGVSDEMILWAEKELGTAIPSQWHDFLKCTNGFYLNDLVLFGIPQSQFEKGILNRSKLQPQSIVLANRRNKNNLDSGAAALKLGYIEGMHENTGIYITSAGSIFTHKSQEHQRSTDALSLIEKAAKRA